MAKKKPSKKKLPAKKSSSKKISVSKGKGKVGNDGKVVPKSKKKYTGKKRGRKSGVENRYNSIKSAISSNYSIMINRKIRRYELKIIYGWIKDTYGNQSVKYILQNMDIIIDNFWNEYCNLYPVELVNHELLFKWYNFKEVLTEEKEYHYPTNVIQIDLTAIGEGVLEFFYEDYLSNIEEYYRICRARIRRDKSPQPDVELISALCDVSKKGNFYKYIIQVEGESVLEPTVTPIQEGITTLVTPLPLVNVLPPSAPPTQRVALEPEEAKLDLEKEKLNKEYLLKELKIKELYELLKQKIITFDEYMKALKEI